MDMKMIQTGRGIAAYGLEYGRGKEKGSREPGGRRPSGGGPSPVGAEPVVFSDGTAAGGGASGVFYGVSVVGIGDF